MTILVLNAGSSSLKWKLYQTTTQQALASGLIENIGDAQANFNLESPQLQQKRSLPIPTYATAFKLLFETLEKYEIVDINKLSGVGHRVVHGGEQFTQPTLVNPKTLQKLKLLNALAPLHNPANLLGIETIMELAPHLSNVAVFDTAFHQSIPDYAYRYALPEALYQEDKIRRYGFHGTSHHYLAKQAAHLLKKELSSLNLITLHLGNGASACAIKQGQSVDTSMGFTPLEGLIMGTRSGDIDPAIVAYIMENRNLSIQDVTKLLNKESGLKGVCGENDMRTILKQASEGEEKAQLALNMFVYRIKKYIGAYMAVLGRVDAIVFSGGIGEHTPLLRSRVLEGMSTLFGFDVNEDLNTQNKSSFIQETNAPVALLVIETNEELQIALETAKKLVKPKSNIY